MPITGNEPGRYRGCRAGVQKGRHLQGMQMTLGTGFRGGVLCREMSQDYQDRHTLVCQPRDTGCSLKDIYYLSFLSGTRRDDYIIRGSQGKRKMWATCPKSRKKVLKVLEYNTFPRLWFSFSICPCIFICYLMLHSLRHGNSHQVSAALTDI